MDVILALVRTLFIIITLSILYSFSIPFRKSWAERKLFAKFLTVLIFIYPALVCILMLLGILVTLASFPDSIVDFFLLVIYVLFSYIPIHFFFIQKKKGREARTLFEKLVTIIFFLSFLSIPCFFLINLFHNPHHISDLEPL